jgi:hypothetical protein
MSIRFVIAKYREDISWTKQLLHKVLIYDKSDTPIEGSIPLKNVGREAETFLYHIINNYNNLDDVTVFLQGNPFEHLQKLVGWRAELTQEEKQQVINKANNEITSTSKFSSFYQVHYNVPGDVNHVKGVEMCAKYFHEYHTTFTCAPSAQYVVPKKNILSRPLSFWKMLYDGMHNDIDFNAWCVEILWWLAFNNTMDTSVGGHDEVKAEWLTKYGFHNTL